MPKYIIGEQPAEVKFIYNTDSGTFSINSNGTSQSMFSGVLDSVNITTNNFVVTGGIRYILDINSGFNDIIITSVDNSSVESELLVNCSVNCTISFPDEVQFVVGSDLNFSAGNTYLINIRNLIAVVNKIV